MDEFFKIIENVNLQEISLGLREFIKPKAIEKIVDDILEHCKK